jgi:hypothetical protein
MPNGERWRDQHPWREGLRSPTGDVCSGRSIYLEGQVWSVTLITPCGNHCNLDMGNDVLYLGKRHFREIDFRHIRFLSET